MTDRQGRRAADAATYDGRRAALRRDAETREDARVASIRWALARPGDHVPGIGQVPTDAAQTCGACGRDLPAPTETRPVPTCRDCSRDTGVTDAAAPSAVSVVTDTAAAIVETWSYAETGSVGPCDCGPDCADHEPLVTWLVIARLVTGAAEYVGRQHVGHAAGPVSSSDSLRSSARADARAAATDWRSACRQVTRTLGSGDDARAAGWLDAADYADLQRITRRRAYRMSALTPGAMQHAEDATQTAALLLRHWAADDALPAGYAERLAAMSDDDGRHFLFGAAAHAAVRHFTRSRLTQTHRDALDLDAAARCLTIGADPADRDAAVGVVLARMARRAGRTVTDGARYVPAHGPTVTAPMMSGTVDTFTARCLSRGPTGRLRYRHAAAVLLAGDVTNAARVLYGAANAARVQRVRRLAAADHLRMTDEPVILADLDALIG